MAIVKVYVFEDCLVEAFGIYLGCGTVGVVEFDFHKEAYWLWF